MISNIVGFADGESRREVHIVENQITRKFSRLTTADFHG